MSEAVNRVERRLRLSTRALEEAGIAYAVVGGNAVAIWVDSVDPAAVRNTRDVDLMIRREDLDRIRVALEPLGFVYRHVGGMDVFLDGPDAKVRDAVHLVFAGEMVRPGEPGPNPGVDESVLVDGTRVLALEALVTIKLTAYRDKDRTHLRDLLDVGLLDATWSDRLPPILAQRLQALIKTPNG